MDIIDENGRLFGLANVVDVLVVLLVLSVVGIGTVYLIGGQGETDGEATSFGTFEYTVPADLDAGLVSANDTLRPSGGGDAFNVSDVVYSTTPNGDVHVVARVSYAGTPVAGGTDATVGGSYRMEADAYSADVAVLALNQSTPTLSTRQVPMVLAVNESRRVGHSVEPGTVATVGDRQVATIELITRSPDTAPERAELIGLTLRAWDRDGRLSFGGTRVRVNSPLGVVTDDAFVTGRVYRVGTTEVETG